MRRGQCKGDSENCGKNRGQSLLTANGESFAIVLMDRVVDSAEIQTDEAQRDSEGIEAFKIMYLL